MSHDQPPEALDVFVSYAHEDEDLQDELRKHLASLERQGKIRAWHDRGIKAGEEWAQKIDVHLDASEIILLLISPDFMASQYCSEIEVPRAMQRHQRGSARVIPIIVRPVDWREAPYAKLQVFPKDAKPITLWSNQDEAFLNVQQGLKRAIEDEIRRRRERGQAPPPPLDSLPREPQPGSPVVPSANARRAPLVSTVSEAETTAGNWLRDRRWMVGGAVAILVVLGLVGLSLHDDPVVESPPRGYIHQGADYTNVTQRGRDPLKDDVLLMMGDVSVFAENRVGHYQEIGTWTKDTSVRVRDSIQGNSRSGVWLKCEKVEK